MRHRHKFILVVVLQIVILLVMIGMKWSTLAFGTKILLKTAPVDPWDLFRGDYVILNYEITNLNLDAIPADKDEYRNNETIYVTLKKQGKYWNAVSVSSKRPDDGSLAIKGIVRYHFRPDANLQVDYGIHSYYVPQHEGRRIEDARGSMDVEISVDKWGNAAVSKLFIDGKEVEFQ